MIDPVDRRAVIDELRACAIEAATLYGTNDALKTAFKESLRGINNLPNVEADRKRGRWELDDDPHDGDCRCSCCGTVIEAMNERHHGLLNALTGGKWWTFYKYCPVCGAQMEKGSFVDWALSHGYSDDLTIERVDVNGNYEPSNCTWIPMSEQYKNKQSNCKNGPMPEPWKGDT